ncbi:MAG: linear amide C-N hydrolase [Candidatus Aminicenantes bacterium]|nr:MAG: linear amide C-N hydrolase [Candidatus Aminicenantes bacterium]
MLKKGSTLIVGHNLDERGHVPGVVVINKRDVFKRGKSWYEILSGKPAPNPPLEWISKYGSVTFNPFCRDFPDGGMNEAGLFIEEMTLQGTSFPEDESKPLVFMMQWMQYVLDSYETIDQVIQSAQDFTIDGWAWHFFTADRKGNAAVIEFLDGEVKVFGEARLPVTALCNTKYNEEMERLRKFEGFGGGQAIDFDNKKLPRFVHAAQMLKDYDPSERPAVEYGFDILAQLERGGTRWSFVCDLKSLKAYFRTSRSPKIKELDLKSFDLSCKTPVKMLDIHSLLAGNVEEDFRDYSLDYNREFVKKAIREFGKDFENFLTSEGSTLDQVIERLASFSELTQCEK